MDKDTNAKAGSGKGCLATLIVFGLMFGVPALIMFSGARADGLLAQVFMVLVAALVNFGLYRYRKSQTFTQTTYYELRSKGPAKEASAQAPAALEAETVHHGHTVQAESETRPVEPDQTQPVGNKFCTACGTKITPGNKFCSHCGVKF